jgi:hypothetical protein
VAALRRSRAAFAKAKFALTARSFRRLRLKPPIAPPRAPKNRAPASAIASSICAVFIAPNLPQYLFCVKRMSPADYLLSPLDKERPQNVAIVQFQSPKKGCQHTGAVIWTRPEPF